MQDGTASPRYSQVNSDPVVPHERVLSPNGAARRGQLPQRRALGNATKKVEISPLYVAHRSRRYRLHKYTRSLLPDMRVAKCMMHCGAGGVEVVQTESGIASFRGARACGSVWACPVCSHKIANTRREELNTLLAWARQQGFIPVLLTLTLRHGLGDVLAESLNVLKSAKKRLHQSHSWLKVKPYLVGHVTATEVTYGASGWHPHYHVLMVLDCDSEDDAIDIVEGARQAWLNALQHCGYDCNRHGFQVQDAAAAGCYVAKWGPAEEMTLTGSKSGRGRGLSPWQLLEAYADGDPIAGALFSNYAYTFQGRHQLVWSPGLKQLVGLGEVNDQEAANLDEEPLGITIAIVESDLWRRIVWRNLQVSLLEVLEDQGAAGLHDYLSRLRQKLLK